MERNSDEVSCTDATSVDRSVRRTERSSDEVSRTGSTSLDLSESDSKLRVELKIQVFYHGDLLSTGDLNSDSLSRESVRMCYSYSGDQSCELGRVTNVSGNHARPAKGLRGLGAPEYGAKVLKCIRILCTGNAILIRFAKVLGLDYLERNTHN